MVDAVVLAGSYNNNLLKECSPARYEALITIGSKTMVEYVVDALVRSRLIEQVVVAGPPEINAFFPDGGVQVVEAGPTIMETIKLGLECLPGARRVLLVSCDVPLLTPQAIENFLELCEQQADDFYYPIIPREVVEKRFPMSKRTYVSFREGTFTGGNIFLINPEAFRRCFKKGEQLVNSRKSPFQMCRLVGFVFLIKFLLRIISLHEAHQKVCKFLGIKGRAVVCEYPEVGIDVDKPGDLALVCQALGFE